MLGHELTHIRNGDVRMLVIAVIIAGVIGFFAELLFRMMFQGGLRWRRRTVSSGDGDRGKGGGAACDHHRHRAGGGGVAAVRGDPLRIVAKARISGRRRLGRADQEPRRHDLGAAQDRRPRRIARCTSAVMEMCIDNPREGFSNLFATHPPVESRIAALVQFAGGHDPGPLELPEEATDRRTAAAARSPRTRPGPGAAMQPPQPSRSCRPSRRSRSAEPTGHAPALGATGKAELRSPGTSHPAKIVEMSTARPRQYELHGVLPCFRSVSGDTAPIWRARVEMAKPAVILVGADKGGVGKTTVSRALLDYFIAHNIPTRAFDTESPKGTLKRFHPEITEVVDMHSTADQMKISTRCRDAQVTVIDIRAGLLSTDAARAARHRLPRRREEGPAHLHGVPYPRPLDRLARRDRRDRGLHGRRPLFPGEELHQQHHVLRVGSGDLQLLLQQDQGRPRHHHPEAQRDGLRTGRDRVGALSSRSSPTRPPTASPPTIRSCCAAMSGIGSATCGPSSTASS